MRGSSKSSSRTPAAKTAGSQGGATVAVAATPADNAGAGASGESRSTRLRSGHTSKIDYLKLHNQTAAATGTSARSGRKRAQSSTAATPTAAATAGSVDKRPRLQQQAASSAAAVASAPAASTAAAVYACPACPASFSSSRTIDQHLLASHAGFPAFRCAFCDLRLRTIKALQHHYVKQHRVYAPVPDCLRWSLTHQCRACGQCFGTAKQLWRHMDWTHSRCSSIVLMEKLPDSWRWSRDRAAILESADSVEEEYNLAFPGRRQFYDGHPGLLEADLSIRLQPAAAAAAASGSPDRHAAAAVTGAAAAAASGFDVYDFDSEDGNSGDGGGNDREFELDIVPTTPAGRGRGASVLKPRSRQQQQQQKPKPKQKRRVAATTTMEIDFEQLLQQRDEAEELEAAGRHQSQSPPPPRRKPSPQRRRQQQPPPPPQQQQQRPFAASDAPGHYVTSRAGVPAPQQSFPCPICMADMATLKSRDRHLMARHPGVRAFACLECDCTFETYIALRRHVRAAHPLAESGAYRLLIAPGLRRRAHQRAAVANTATAAALKPFQCTACGAAFDRVHQLSAHFAAAHEGDDVGVVRSKRSGVGGAVLRDGASGFESASIDLDVSTGKQPTDSIGLRTMDDLKLTCELCSGQFDKITALERHIAVDHVDDTPYECHHCPAYFPSFGRLRHHQRTVHRLFLQWKEPPQAMLAKLRGRGGGGGAAANAAVLNVAVPLRRSDMAKVAHQQLEFFDAQAAAGISLEAVVSAMAPGETVIFCDFCGETCHNKLELGRHLQSHSGKRLRFGCSKCGQVFEGWNAKSDLVDHMKVDHMGKPRYRCKHCEAQFKFSSLLKQHRERGGCNTSKPIARPVVSYGCSSCDKIFCGEASAERYRQHSQQCRGQLSRALPSSAAVQPPPMAAVVSGLGGGGGGGDVHDEEAAATAVAGGDGGARVLQVTLPGSDEPVSVLLHLEGPLPQDALSEPFVLQTAPEAAVPADEASSAEPLQSLAQFAAAAADEAAAAAAAAAATATSAEGCSSSGSNGNEAAPSGTMLVEQELPQSTTTTVGASAYF